MLWYAEWRRWAAVLLIGSLAIATAQFSKGKNRASLPVPAYLVLFYALLLRSWNALL